MLARNIIQKLNIDAAEVAGPFRGYRNSSYKVTTKFEIFNLVIFNQEENLVERIKTQNEICTKLAKLDLTFQIRYPKSKIIQVYNKNISQCISKCCLYNYIEGQTISWESYTAKRLKKIGKTLVELHLRFNQIELDSNIDTSKLPTEKQVCLDQIIEMRNYFSRKGVKLALYKKLHLVLNIAFEKLEKIIADIENSNQLLHMDFVRGNIIWDNETQNQIVGIIDFEKMSLGKVEFDIARTLAFLIIDSKYKTESEVREKFLSAYGMNFDIDLVEKLVKFFLIYDFYKFLKHNPYEFLDQNEHFIRTREYLIESCKLLTGELLVI